MERMDRKRATLIPKEVVSHLFIRIFRYYFLSDTEVNPYKIVKSEEQIGLRNKL